MSERAISTVQPFNVQSAADAKVKLDEMIAQHQRSTPAANKLSNLLGDPSFLRSIDHGGQHGASDGHALPGGASFDRLQDAVTEARAEAGDPISRAIAGELSDINDSGYLHQKQTADALRVLGMKDDVIRQVLAGEPVSRAEHESVQRWKSEAMKDEKWRAAYLKGDPDCVRQMTNAMVVLTSPIKEDAA
ncbi:hypothetical protein AYJ54_07915 [Bradyrhizobium centrolobii]|uniref:Uncharacterized protein n=1 Tax=Bradyrhizobium centrolobii TaxID=1505087 RepID=A0A176YWM2_9BRAD|nr:hypothetical protein [Bradyrhizobium centrolobii]OAF11777.1 hypothetical protein AYJ54_07915 [Bradyrhizobium centrolobii]